MSLAVTCRQCGRRSAATRPRCPDCGSKRNPDPNDYTLIFRDSYGKQRSRHLGMMTAAQAMTCEAGERAVHEAEFEARQLQAARRGWEKTADAYLRHLDAEGRNKQYRCDQLRYLRRMSAFWGDAELTQIMPALIRRFRDELRAAGLSEASCDRHLAAGKAAWRYSVDDIQNPFCRVAFYNPDNSVTRYLTEAQRSALLTAAKGESRDWYEMILTGVLTGLRRRNVHRLRRDEVDFERKTITVTQKGQRAHWIPLNSQIHEVLAAAAHNGTPYFWINPGTGKPWECWHNGPWRRIKARAGIPENFRFHDLRHDAGTEIYRLTGDVRMAQRLLGHRQLKTTERYAHVTEDALRDGAELLRVETGGPIVVKRKGRA